MEAVRIGYATKGGITLKDLREMSLDQIDMIVKEIKNISQEIKDAAAK